ncbi:hypothetical protein [Phenylobacterium sp.]|uniref:hypothetical protein n=1 Tax=Phenylobacterium sp. TaxID=1871053 RepID=UPI00356641B2
MAGELNPTQPMQALVSRSELRPGAPATYLRLNEGGASDWTLDPHDATPFDSMREAARMALRLPAALRAYGLPRNGEMTLTH